MKISAHWLQSLLEPHDLTAQQAEQALTDLGFPIDAREAVAAWAFSPSASKPTQPDARLEVEVTSNRGDILGHLPMAREIAAKTGRRLITPKPPQTRTATGASLASSLSLEVTCNQSGQPPACPRFTAHIIRNVKVGPSPAWLAGALEAVGQRSINNIVDVTNYINFLYGQPAHAFDLDRLAGQKLIVRWAKAGESLKTLDGKARTLQSDELVIADAERPQSLAGVMGGGDSEVSSGTRNVVLEVATWDPLVVRRAARRHQLRTDAGHRYERRVHADALDAPARLAAALIADVGGGELVDGMLDVRVAASPIKPIELRLGRCRQLLGVEIPREQIERLFNAIDLRVLQSSPASLTCQPPPARHDLLAEIDLIEEVARLSGYDAIPIHDRVAVALKPVQPSEQAMDRITRALTSLGFFETVTYSFTAPALAKPFLPQGQQLVEVDDDRRKHEPTLRPSVLAGLLACRRANRDARVAQPGGIRLFEIASAFSQQPGTAAPGSSKPAPVTIESRRLAMVVDVHGVAPGKQPSVEALQAAVRQMRAAIEAVVAAIAPSAVVEFRASQPALAAFDVAMHATVIAANKPMGSIGALTAATLRAFSLDVPTIGAEIEIDSLALLSTKRARAAALPAFPGIERDLSLDVAESVSWTQIEKVVNTDRPARLEHIAFVGTYRGQQVGAGKKSVTLRMSFRDPARTLEHHEVDPEVASVVQRASQALGAVVRQ